MHDIDRTQRELEFEDREHEHEHGELEQAGEAFVGELAGEAEYEQEQEQEQEQFLGGVLGSLFGEAEHEHEAELEQEAQEQEGEAESPLSESQEMELASELLEVSNEGELEHFLGGLLGKAMRGIRGFARSPRGRILTGALKGLAKKALPVIGTAAGGAFGGPLGAKVGGGLGRLATNLFELELEGLSHEDREFEVARQFVRLGAAAAKRAAAMPRLPPQTAARRALTAAARVYAPGLLSRRPHPGCAACSSLRKRKRMPRGSAAGYASPAVSRPGMGPVRRTNGVRPNHVVDTAYTTTAHVPVHGSAGRWYRRGNNVVLVDL